jgi:hypothetical protein
MMLSPQAARMGTVHTTLRQIGFKSSVRSHCYSTGMLSNRRTLNPRSKNVIGYYRQPCHFLIDKIHFSQTHPSRSKSTAAISDIDIDSTIQSLVPKNQHRMTAPIPSGSQAIATEIRTKIISSSFDNGKVTSNNEPWRINLGRGSDNDWLLTPRIDNEWFTGVSPGSHLCPGTSIDREGHLYHHFKTKCSLFTFICHLNRYQLMH